MDGKEISVQLYEVEQPDTLLWAMWCLQQYAKFVGRQQCFSRYGDLIHRMMSFIFEGKHPNLFAHNNGLLYSNGRDKAVTSGVWSSHHPSFGLHRGVQCLIL